MTRTRPPQRLVEVASAATRVFGRLGYRRTHMADVAAEAGLSSGAIYSYVESKDALFHLVFAHAFGHFAEGVPVLPLPTRPMAETLELISQGLRKAGATPVIRAALEVENPVDVRAELAAIVEERYAMQERLWPVFAVIEQSAADLPQLEEFYFRRGRPRYHGELARYLDRRAQRGHLRPIASPAITARLVGETIAWFAWHRRGDRDAGVFDDDAARHTVIGFVCDALVAPQP